MIAANVEIQKIRHGALPQPVEQIAQRAPDDKPEGGGRETVVGSLDPAQSPATMASVNAIRIQAGASPNNPKLTPVLKPSTRLKKSVTGMT